MSESTSPAKVLVIDDSQEIHTLVKIRLAKEKVEIASAMDGAAGLSAARELQPDLILLDVDMPGTSGFDICRKLKDDPATMECPVIFLTGAASTEEKIRGLELGAADYVTKPFDPAELRARVRAALRTKYLMDLLARKAMVDGLTGLWNRMYFDARLATELAAARRSGRPIACIMADVDRFKSINDTAGHTFGDEVLRSIAQILQAECREEDILCRYGGEEFGVILPGTTSQVAAEVAERLRVAVESRAPRCHDEHSPATCSFGVAGLPDHVPPTIIERADEALYRAKRAGRNRVEQAQTAAAEAA